MSTPTFMKIGTLGKRTWRPLVFFVVFLMALWVTHTLALQRFVSAYDRYQEKAKIQEDAAYLPGTTGNPLRQQLNQTLSEVLTKETSTERRLFLAHQGLSTIDQANREVDIIGTTGTDVSDTVAMMTAAANSVGNLYGRGTMVELIALAKEQMDIIENIRGLSYRANFETAEIFKRIIVDHGTLTAGYTTELNNQIPKVEEQFNSRENYYVALESNVNRMEQKMALMKGPS